MPPTLPSNHQTFFGTLFDTLYPPVCAFCNIGAGIICDGCHDELQKNTPACQRCARTLADSVQCADCLATPPPWLRAYVPLRYAFPLDIAIKRFKFHGAQHYVPVFAELLRATCSRLPDAIDTIQPMPLHWRRHAWRGFNQATEIARPVARMLGKPIGDHVRRAVHTEPQSSLPSAARQRNLDRIFRPRQSVRGQHVLIVDDVLTTGASVAALSRCLQNAGAGDVSVLALARS